MAILAQSVKSWLMLRGTDGEVSEVWHTFRAREVAALEWPRDVISTVWYVDFIPMACRCDEMARYPIFLLSLIEPAALHEDSHHKKLAPRE